MVKGDCDSDPAGLNVTLSGEIEAMKHPEGDAALEIGALLGSMAATVYLLASEIDALAVKLEEVKAQGKKSELRLIDVQSEIVATLQTVTDRLDARIEEVAESYVTTRDAMIETLGTCSYITQDLC